MCSWGCDVFSFPPVTILIPKSEFENFAIHCWCTTRFLSRQGYPFHFQLSQKTCTNRQPSRSQTIRTTCGDLVLESHSQLDNKSVNMKTSTLQLTFICLAFILFTFSFSIYLRVAWVFFTKNSHEVETSWRFCPSGIRHRGFALLVHHSRSRFRTSNGYSGGVFLVLLWILIFMEWFDFGRERGRQIGLNEGRQVYRLLIPTRKKSKCW